MDMTVIDNMVILIDMYISFDAQFLRNKLVFYILIKDSVLECACGIV
jgi:hypothetical protein